MSNITKPYKNKISETQKVLNMINKNQKTKKSFKELYENTIKKKQKCIELGYNYIEIWEHDWNIFIKNIIKLQRLYRNNKSKQHIAVI